MGGRSKLYILNPEVVDLYLAGQSCREIADRFDTVASAVWAALRKAGVETRRKGRPSKWNEVSAEMAQMYEQGMTCADIAEHFSDGLSSGVVYHHLKNVGVKMRRPGRREGVPGDRKYLMAIDDIVERRKSGETYQKIGDAYGICRERVRQILHSYGHGDLTGHRRAGREMRA